MERSLDSILESFPVSFFHYRLLIMCGLAFCADAMEVSLLAFLSFCAGDEWNLSNAEKASITGVVFAGELAGSLFWGPMADKFGRKIAFIVACVMISVAGFLSGVSPSYGWLLFFRAVVGFGVGGLTVPFDLLAEFLPSKDRGKFLIFIEYFWTVGSLFVTGVAWLCLSTAGWRVLTYITAAPVTLASLLTIWYLPESPRWLLVKGRLEEAEKIVRETARECGVELGDFKLVLTAGQSSPAPVVDASYFDLFRTPEARRVTLPLATVWTVFGFTYYGVILFVSRLYAAESTNDDSGKTCFFDYQAIFLNSLSEIFGVLVAALTVDNLGRTRTQAVLYVIGGIAVAFMGMDLNIVAITVISMAARLCAMGASCATWVATPELFPTEMRATGHSLCNSAARIGGFCAPYFVVSDASPLTVGLVLCAFNGLAALASMALPETSGLSLDMGVEQARHESEESTFTGPDYGILASSPKPSSSSEKLWIAQSQNVHLLGKETPTFD